MRVGERVAERFELEAVAGEGGMGTVYRARDLSTGETVALKKLTLEDQHFVERFAREAAILAEVQHPGIVRYIAHGKSDDGQPYLVMEWLAGEDLKARIRRGRLTVAETLELAERLADALAAAHKRGIVHRDVKPQNILLPEGRLAEAKLVDFGIARLDVVGPDLTQTGMILGTPGYLAPEQATRGAKGLDARADVFSLGCVLFECLTGRPTFRGDNPLAVLSKILLEEPPRASASRPDMPPWLDDLVTSMLAKEPSRRPRDGAAVAAALAALEAPAITPPPPTAATALTSEERRLVGLIVVGSDGPAVRGAVVDTIQARPVLAARVRPFGARFDELLDGSRLLLLRGEGAATDLAVRAARCALAVRPLFPNLPVALAVGRGVVDDRPLGEIVDTAVALLEAARYESTVCVDPLAAALLADRFELEVAGAHTFLRAERPLHRPRTLLGKESCCLGREHELQRLESTYSNCTEEPTSRAVLVTAAAGVGKTRVCHEFMLRLAQQHPNALVLFAQADVIGAGSPFSLVSRAIRRSAGISDGESLAARQKKLRERVARHLAPSEVARVVGFLGELTDTPFDDEDNAPLRAARHDASLMRDNLQTAFEDWLRAECEAHPVVLVLEDLHWGDQPSVRLVDGALRALRDRPLLVLAFARPDVHEVFPRMWSGRGLEEHELPRLPRRACEQLVREALPELDESLAARVVERADGNAFYLEELIRTVAEDAAGALPESVVAMAQARLESLAAEPRRVLRAASIFGERFPVEGLRALLGGDTPDAMLRDLIDREVLVEHGRSHALSFRHALLREAAYAMLTDEDRRIGHRLAAEWLEHGGAADANVLADQFARGGDPVRAIPWFLRAAQQAAEGDDYAAAKDRAERGIACGAAGETLGSLLLVCAEASQAGTGHEMARLTDEARALLWPGSPEWCRAVGEGSWIWGRLGGVDRLVELANLLLAQDPRRRAVAVARARLAGELFRVGGGDTARALLDAIDRSDETIEPWWHRAWAFEARWRGDLGDEHDECVATAECLERVGDRRNSYIHRGLAGALLAELGAFPQAERALRSVLSRPAHYPTFSKELGSVLRLALVRQGVFDAARAVPPRPSRLPLGSGDMLTWRCLRAEVAIIPALAMDAVAAARTAIAEVAHLAPLKAYAHAILAQVLLESGSSADALDEARQGIETLPERDPPLDEEPRVRLAWAEALLASGNHAEATRAFALARERLLRRADCVRDEKWRAVYLAAPPENARILARARELTNETSRTALPEILTVVTLKSIP